jgi:Prophage tail length tape measure protein
MSFDLSQLKFTVETTQLADAITMVKDLSTAVAGLKTPFKQMAQAATEAGKSTETATVASETSTKKQVKQVDVMSQAVKAFYKEQDKLAKEALKQQERVLEAGATMNNGAVAAYEKYLESQVKAQVKAADAKIKQLKRETQAMDEEAKRQETILERQKNITGFMAEKGASRGQASMMAAAVAKGQGADVASLFTELQTQQKFKGGDPFDKSVEGLRTLKQELGQAREGYRQLVEFTKKYEAVKAEGKGEEVSLVGLNKKETDNLYRDKQRAFEVFKQNRVALKEDVAARVAAAETTRELGNQELKEQKLRFRESLRDTEEQYKAIATQKRPIENIRAVDSTRQRDKLNYLARATSVQLGDIGVSLAGGQNPLTVFMQQGDQMRAIFGEVGREGVDMQKVLSSAFTQIVSGFKEVAVKLVEFVGGAIASTAVAIANFAARLTLIPQMLKGLTEGFTLLGFSFKGLGEDSKFAGFIKSVSPLITGLAATGILLIVTAIIALGVAFKNILAVQHELNTALVTTGASLALTKEEAMKMSDAFSSGSATSIGVLKVLTEIAQAGNLSKDSIEGITKSAVEMNRYLGVSTKSVVDEYSKLATDPVKTLTEIGLATGRISANTVDGIKDLEEYGKHTEAVALATKELDRIFGEMSQNARDNMTPLSKLWDDMKQTMNLLTESVYKFAESDSVINTLAAVWKTLAIVVSEVGFVLKGVGVELGAIAAQAGAVLVGDFAGASRIGSMVKEDAKSARKAQDDYTNSIISGDQLVIDSAKKLTEEKAKYITVMKDGLSVKRLENQAELDARLANREQLKAQANWEKYKTELGSNRRLDDTRRAEEIAKEKSKIDISYQAQKNFQESSLALPNADKAAIKKNLKDLADMKESLYIGVDKKYKPEADKSGAAAIKDEINSRQQAIDNARKESDRSFKMASEQTSSEQKRGLMDEEAYINQKYKLDTQKLRDDVGFLEQEKKIAAEKINSKKEVVAFQGKIDKINSDIKDEGIKKENALLELQFKQYELRKKLIEADSTKQYDDKQKEIDTLVQANEQQRLQNELIGKGQEQINKITLTRQQKIISDKEDALVGLKNLDIIAEEINFQGQLVNVLERNTQERELAVQQGEREIELLKKKKTLTTDEQYKSFVAKNFAPDVSPLSSPIIGAATAANAPIHAEGSGIIASMEAEKKLIATKLEEANVSDTIREADKKRFDELSTQIDSLKDRLTLNLKITGLEDLTTQLNGLLGGFTTLATNNLETITASIGRMGDSYKGQFKGMLKDAQDQANMYGKVQKATVGVSSGLKTIFEGEKKFAEGSKERTIAQVEGYGQMAGAAAEFFDKGSTGYNVLKAAETGFRAFEMAMSVQSVAQNSIEAASKIAANGGVALSGVMAGAAQMFAELGPFGFPAIAAMLAVMASLGFSGGSAGSFGTLGAGNSIDATGRSTKGKTTEDMNAGTNYNTATGTYSNQNKPQLTDAEVKARADAAAIDAAANAVNNLRIESMKLTKGSEELEKSLMRARMAAGGSGLAAYELATQGMTEAQLASYNYNQALKGQISVQMDIANGTELTSANMKKLADESQQLAIDLMKASGDIAGAKNAQTIKDTAGYTAEEIAVYNSNQAQKDAIQAAQDSAAAAQAAAQAEEQLAKTRWDLSGRLNILLGRQTQKEFDRATELAATTDNASISMLKLIYQLEDMNAAIDTAFATLERSIAAERKLAEVRLKSATDLQTLLKGAKDTSTTAMTRQAAQAQLSMFLAIAKSSGTLPSAEALKPAITAIGKPSEELFSSFVDYQRDFLRTANDIGNMSDLADKQVTAEQATIDRLDAQLAEAKAQVDALKGIDNSVKDVATAINDFHTAMQTLSSTQQGAPAFSFTPPTPSSSSSGSGSSSSSTSGSGAATGYESIAGQDNKDIVAAYREYYNRNPDESGYKSFLDSHLSGDKLMKAILGASAVAPEGQDFKTAVSKGYDPLNPEAKFLKSLLSGSAASTLIDGSFAQGINYVPNDMVAQIHKGERILPAADNAELFSRLQNPQDNAVVMASAIARLTEEVQMLRAEQRQTVVNTGDTTRMLKRVTGEGDAINVAVTTS